MITNKKLHITIQTLREITQDYNDLFNDEFKSLQLCNYGLLGNEEAEMNLELKWRDTITPYEDAIKELTKRLQLSCEHDDLIDVGDEDHTDMVCVDCGKSDHKAQYIPATREELLGLPF